MHPQASSALAGADGSLTTGARSNGVPRVPSIDSGTSITSQEFYLGLGRKWVSTSLKFPSSEGRRELRVGCRA